MVQRSAFLVPCLYYHALQLVHRVADGLLLLPVLQQRDLSYYQRQPLRLNFSDSPKNTSSHALFFGRELLEAGESLPFSLDLECFLIILEEQLYILDAPDDGDAE
jgi:hypothetical protein